MGGSVGTDETEKGDNAPLQRKQHGRGDGRATVCGVVGRGWLRVAGVYSVESQSGVPYGGGFRFYLYLACWLHTTPY